MVNPEGRANNRDLESDAAGRYNGRADRMQGHSSGKTVNAVEHEAEWFAKSVSQYLDKAVHRGGAQVSRAAARESREGDTQHRERGTEQGGILARRAGHRGLHQGQDCVVTCMDGASDFLFLTFAWVPRRPVGFALRTCVAFRPQALDSLTISAKRVTTVHGRRILSGPAEFSWANFGAMVCIVVAPIVAGSSVICVQPWVPCPRARNRCSLFVSYEEACAPQVASAALMCLLVIV